MLALPTKNYSPNLVAFINKLLPYSRFITGSKFLSLFFHATIEIKQRFFKFPEEKKIFALSD